MRHTVTLQIEYIDIGAGTPLYANCSSGNWHILWAELLKHYPCRYTRLPLPDKTRI